MADIIAAAGQLYSYLKAKAKAYLLKVWAELLRG